MPLFETKEEYIENIDNLEILEWICPNLYNGDDSCYMHSFYIKGSKSNSCNITGINYIEKIKKSKYGGKKYYIIHTHQEVKILFGNKQVIHNKIYY